MGIGMRYSERIRLGLVDWLLRLVGTIWWDLGDPSLNLFIYRIVDQGLPLVLSNTYGITSPVLCSSFVLAVDEPALTLTTSILLFLRVLCSVYQIKP